MTDYLEEALEGLDALVRRLRRMAPFAADKEENVYYLPDMRRNTGIFREKNRNVSEIEKEVDGMEFGINRNINRVYNLDADGRISPWGAAAGGNSGSPATRGGDAVENGGGPVTWGVAAGENNVSPSAWRGDAGVGAGSGAIPQPAELAQTPTGRDGGRDSGSVPRRGPETGWISGEAAEAWTPAGEIGTSATTAPEEMRWAEQADRVFRRDSRRYDGGFYLY